MKSFKIVIGAATLAIVGVGVLSITVRAFDPQPDPPGFGLVTLVNGQSIRVNVVCSPHGVRRFPPGPCSGDLLIHDAAGNTLASQEVRLLPGQAASLAFDLFREAGGPFGIDPCWIPSDFNTGHAIPSAEVFSTETGRTMLFINPAVARLSALQVEPPEPEAAAGIR